MVGRVVQKRAVMHTPQLDRGDMQREWMYMTGDDMTWKKFRSRMTGWVLNEAVIDRC